jgi:hypothetical protein
MQYPDSNQDTINQTKIDKIFESGNFKILNEITSEKEDKKKLQGSIIFLQIILIIKMSSQIIKISLKTSLIH